MLTPYQFASNTPIAAIDLDGLERYLILNDFVDKKRQKITIVEVRDVKNNNELVNMKATNASGSVVPSDILVFNRGDLPEGEREYELKDEFDQYESQVYDAGVDKSANISDSPRGLTKGGFEDANGFSFLGTRNSDNSYISNSYIGGWEENKVELFHNVKKPVNKSIAQDFGLITEISGVAGILDRNGNNTSGILRTVANQVQNIIDQNGTISGITINLSKGNDVNELANSHIINYFNKTIIPELIKLTGVNNIKLNFSTKVLNNDIEIDGKVSIQESKGFEIQKEFKN